MLLSQLLQALPEDSFQFITPELNLEISSVEWDYTKIQQNSLYFAFKKEEFQEDYIKQNSFDHIQDAIQRGASVIVCPLEHSINTAPLKKVTIIKLSNFHQSMAKIAKVFFNQPFREMKVIGITGTNGKTSTTQFIDRILQLCSHKTGVIGTLGTIFESNNIPPSSLSTPLAIDLFRSGSEMKKEKVSVVSMEVTSHGMHYERVAAIEYDIAVFTNLTQDHLDFHKSFDEYKNEKLKFFQSLGNGKKKGLGVVNIDDRLGLDFINAVSQGRIDSKQVSFIRYGILNKDADLVAYPAKLTGSSCCFELLYQGVSWGDVKIPVAGMFNIYNCLAAIGAAIGMGISRDDILKVLPQIKNIEGRFEKVPNDLNLNVFIDYAHTPDSLEKALKTLKGITKGEVHVVFGCGGNRDKKKRPLMGAIGVSIADKVIITNDTPRKEQPQHIVDDILEGLSSTERLKTQVVLKRKTAIQKAIFNLSKNDSLLIAGKGHETFQIIKEKKIPFSDRASAIESLQNLILKKNRFWLEISEENVRRNWNLINLDKPKNLKTLFVTKDNALGHGSIEMSKIAIEKGASYLGVATLSEAIELRENKISHPILILGERQDQEIKKCLELDLSIQIQSMKTATLINKTAKKIGEKIKVHVKVDSGMGRYGIPWDQAFDFYQELKGFKHIKIEGIMTHFSQSDETKKDYANLQWKRFNSVLDQLKEKKLLPALIHACNSGGYLDLEHAHGNMVRVGILPFGVYPSAVCRQINVDGQELKPVMSLKSKISFIKTLEKGDQVGYGMHFTAKQKTKIAVLPFGYGDGYPRVRNAGKVLIKNKEAPIIGGNAMDATMIDISNLKSVKAGDEVIVMGESKNKSITARDIAVWGNTVCYDIMTRWNKRVERLYV